MKLAKRITVNTNLSSKNGDKRKFRRKMRQIVKLDYIFEETITLAANAARNWGR